MPPLLFFLLIPLLHAHPLLRQGYTLFPCTTSADCNATLQCTDATLQPCSNSSSSCVCLPPSNLVRLCSDSQPCPLGEICATGDSIPQPFCIDATTVDTSPDYHQIPNLHSIPPDGLTWAKCTTNSSCAMGYTCLKGATECQLDGKCRCQPLGGLRLCNEGCVEGEICATGLPLGNAIVCVSEIVVREEVEILPVSEFTDETPEEELLQMSAEPIVEPQGLAFEKCASQDDCRPPRECLQDFETPCQPGPDPACSCQYPGSFRECNGRAGCDDGEGCYLTEGAENGVCISDLVASMLPNVQQVVEDELLEMSEEPLIQPEGLAFEKCASQDDCKPPRECRQDFETPCQPGPDPACSCQYPGSFRECNGRADCDDGEGCYRSENQQDAICISDLVASTLLNVVEEVVEGDVDATPEENTDGIAGGIADDTDPTREPVLEEEGVCVDAGLLEEFEGSDLVFGEHRWTRVLCDNAGSCATTGHMVEWRGDAIRMSSYCGIVGCNEELRWVNSPRWKRGLRVASKTDGLKFTALAARWDTTMEEMVLRVGVRLGM